MDLQQLDRIAALACQHRTWQLLLEQMTPEARAQYHRDWEAQHLCDPALRSLIVEGHA